MKKAGAGRVKDGGRLIGKGKAPGKRGGSVVEEGTDVRLTRSSRIEADGGPGAAGGTVLIGGGYQGKDAAVDNARTTEVEAGLTISARGNGDAKGVTVVLWGDERTVFEGSIFANGSGTAGTGGFVDES